MYERCRALQQGGSASLPYFSQQENQKPSYLFLSSAMPLQKSLKVPACAARQVSLRGSPSQCDDQHVLRHLIWVPRLALREHDSDGILCIEPALCQLARCGEQVARDVERASMRCMSTCRRGHSSTQVMEHRATNTTNEQADAHDDEGTTKTTHAQLTA